MNFFCLLGFHEFVQCFEYRPAFDPNRVPSRYMEAYMTEVKCRLCGLVEPAPGPQEKE